MNNLKILIMLILTTLMWMNIAKADIKFKTPRIEKEFTELYRKNMDLYQIVVFGMYASQIRFKKDLIITDIYRTQKEQDRYYKGKKKFRSPHQDWLAIDLRTRHLTKAEIKELVNAINRRYNSRNTYIPTAFYHDIGLGKHIHIQFKERQ